MSKSKRVDDSMAVLATPKATISVHGKTIDISPITLGELPAFTTAVRSIFHLLRNMSGDEETILFDLLQNYPTDFAMLVAVGARTDADWVMALPLDDVASVAEAVVASNRDFFIRRLLPLLKQAIALGNRQTGATSSSASPDPDSPTEISAA